MDYWEHVGVRVWPGWQDFEHELPRLGEQDFFSTKATRPMWSIPLSVYEVLRQR